MSYREEKRRADDGRDYTWAEFQTYYGNRAEQMWNGGASRAYGGAAAAGVPPPRRGHHYEIGMKVRALTTLAGDTGQVVKKGMIGEVTALPGRGSNIDPSAVAEVVISKVRFDAQADMIEPAGAPAPRAERQDRLDRPERAPRQDRREPRSQPPSAGYYDNFQTSAPRGAAPQWQDRPRRAEKRADPSDASGKMYTRDEFVEFYGPNKGGSLWDKAA
eukprot:gene14763-22596_t